MGYYIKNICTYIDNKRNKIICFFCIYIINMLEFKEIHFLGYYNMQKGFYIK
jgi:hypothetical protein